MPLALEMLRTVLLVAGLSLAGRWVLGLLAGASRERNVIYQLLSVVASPAVKAAALVLPRRVAPRSAALLAWLFIVGAYFAIGLWQRDLCLRDLGQAACENWAGVRGRSGH